MKSWLTAAALALICGGLFLIAQVPAVNSGTATYPTSGTICGSANATCFQVANNLSEGVAATMRTNIGLGTAATQSTGTFAQVANNLSDLANAATARTNLGVPGTASPTFTGTVTQPSFNSTTNCSSAASPAVCTSAAAGSIAIPTGVTSVVLQVNTTAVTANSQIYVVPDDTLGTKLSVTCNSTLATLVGGMAITARSAGASFTVTYNGTIATNPLCASFLIVN
jgi:hypothetical protein